MTRDTAKGAFLAAEEIPHSPFSIDNERSEASERDLQERLKAAGDSAGIDMRALTQDLAGYREPHHGRSVVEILITIVPLVLLWLSMWFALKLGYGLYLLLAVPAAGFLVRLFMIQHDCGHGAFFRHRFANDWVGRVIGVLTMTPYDFWRRTHAVSITLPRAISTGAASATSIRSRSANICRCRAGAGCDTGSTGIRW